MGFLNGFLRQMKQDPGQGEANYSDNIRKIEAVLGKHEGDRPKFLAAFALLMGRVAYADSDISDGERARMKEIVLQEMRLAPEDAQAVTDLALERTVVNQGENHLVIRAVRDSADKGERADVVRALLLLAAEDNISEIESEEIKLIAKGLGFNQGDFISLRSEFKKHLSVLK